MLVNRRIRPPVAAAGLGGQAEGGQRADPAPTPPAAPPPARTARERPSARWRTRTVAALRYPPAPTDRQTEGASRQGRPRAVPVADRRRAPRPRCRPTGCAQSGSWSTPCPCSPPRSGRCRCSHNRTRATEFLHACERTRRVSWPARCMGVVSGVGVVVAKAAAPFTGNSETDQVRVDASALTRFSCSRWAGPCNPLVERGRLQVGEAKTSPARAGPGVLARMTAPTRWTSTASSPSSMPTATGRCAYPSRADLRLRAAHGGPTLRSCRARPGGSGPGPYGDERGAGCGRFQVGRRMACTAVS